MSKNNGSSPSVILTPKGRDIVRVPYELMRAVEACDTLLRRHGMQMKILCETCYHRQAPDPHVHGDNRRESTTWKLTCAHAERLYSLDTTGVL